MTCHTTFVSLRGGGAADSCGAGLHTSLSTAVRTFDERSGIPWCSLSHLCARPLNVAACAVSIKRFRKRCDAVKNFMVFSALQLWTTAQRCRVCDVSQAFSKAV